MGFCRVWDLKMKEFRQKRYHVFLLLLQGHEMTLGFYCAWNPG
jgi:hypothetical protein